MRPAEADNTYVYAENNRALSDDDALLDPESQNVAFLGHNVVERLTRIVRIDREGLRRALT